jgi:hypothetical protein
VFKLLNSFDELGIDQSDGKKDLSLRSLPNRIRLRTHLLPSKQAMITLKPKLIDCEMIEKQAKMKAEIRWRRYAKNYNSWFGRIKLIKFKSLFGWLIASAANADRKNDKSTLFCLLTMALHPMLFFVTLFIYPNCSYSRFAMPHQLFCPNNIKVCF